MREPIPGARKGDAFGYRGPVKGVQSNDFHSGQDYPAERGTPIQAMHTGTVQRTWWDVFVNGSPAGGNMVEILGDDGKLSRYAHCDTIAVQAGQRVTEGQPIAYVGSTGASTGNHVHVEVLVWVNGKWVYVDPLAHITTNQNRSKMTYRVLNLRETVDGGKTATDKIFFDNGRNIVHIQAPEHVDLLIRFIADAPGDRMFPVQIETIREYLS